MKGAVQEREGDAAAAAGEDTAAWLELYRDVQKKSLAKLKQAAEALV